MNTAPDWKAQYLAAEAALSRRGVDNVHLSMILFAMVYGGMCYMDALKFYADYRGEAPERMQSSICYHLLKDGVERNPCNLLGDLVDEVNHEN